ATKLTRAGMVTRAVITRLVVIANVIKMIMLIMFSTPSAMVCRYEDSSQFCSVSAGMMVNIQPDSGVQKNIPISHQKVADTSIGQLQSHSIRGLKRLNEARESALNNSDIKNISSDQ